MERGHDDPDSMDLADGNVCLTASYPDGSLLRLRAHKSVLSMHSAVFKTMFSLPRPQDPVEDTMDTLNTVHCYDDPSDLRAFLQCLYNPCFLPSTRFHRDTASLMMGPLKLATKYSVDALRIRIIEIIQVDWMPRTLDEWDHRVDHIAQSFQNSPQCRPRAMPCGQDGNAPEIVIRLGRDCDVPEILPMAFYQLSIHPTRPKPLTREWSMLSRDDLETLAIGRERIGNFFAVENTLGSIDDWRECKMHCASRVVLFWVQLHASIIRKKNPLHVLRVAAITTRDLSTSHGLICSECCRLELVPRLLLLRRQFFNAIPGMFELA